MPQNDEEPLKHQDLVLYSTKSGSPYEPNYIYNTIVFRVYDCVVSYVHQDSINTAFYLNIFYSLILSKLKISVVLLLIKTAFIRNNL